MTRWISRWLFTTNHKDIGVLYFVGSLYFGFIGAMMAILMRTQLSVPDNSLLTAAAYNQATSVHGIVMIFFFLTPLGIALGNYFVPLQIGAKDLALPRLNALSFWMYFTGGIMVLLAFLMPGGNASSEWIMIAPLSDNQYSPGPGPTLAYLGLTLDVVSVIMTTINLLLTVAYMRGPGITWRKVPMFTWFMAFMQLQAMFAFPSLLAGLLFLASDRVAGTFFLSASSGGAILWDNIFWFFGHPEVYVVLLPAFGMVAEILPVFSHRFLAERNLILVLTGAMVVPLSYLVWQHHMFITGVNLSEDQAFSISTLMISLPFDLIIIAFVKTLTKANIELSIPMLFALASIVVFIIGGIAGVFLSSYILDVVFNDTYFVIAHFHYIMVGASIFGLFAGVYFYLPRMTGRLFHEGIGMAHFIVSMVGFNMAFFPMFLLYDMPRRIYTYQALPDWGLLNMIATIGAYIFAFGQILFIVNLVYTVRGGRISPPNPWKSPGLEWTPNIVGASNSPGYSGDAPILPAASPPPAAVQEETEHPSTRPIQLALATGITLFGVALLTSYVAAWLIVAAGVVLIVYSVGGWMWDDFKGIFRILPEVTEVWPFNNITKERLGMWLFVSTEVFLFGAIIASDIYIRINMVWPAAGSIHDVVTGGWSTIALLSSGIAVVFALDSVRKGNQRGMVRWLVGAFVLGWVFIAFHAYEWYTYYYVRIPAFTIASGLAGSTYYFTVGLHAAHVVSGLVIMAFIIRKAMAGGYNSQNYAGVRNFALYWLFIDIVWMFLFPFFYLT